MTETAGKETVKQKVEHELEVLATISLYLFVVLSGLSVYKSMVLRGYSIDSFKMGANAIEALIMAKVIMIGGFMHVGERSKDEPLVLPTLRKSLLYALLMLAFKVVEALIGSLIHGTGLAGGLNEIVTTERGEVAAQTIVMFLALLPFFGTREVNVALGGRNLYRLFFKGKS